MARKTLAELKAAKLAELDKIKNDLAKLESRAVDRIGKIAVTAGLADMDIDDNELRKEFEALASKFRGSTSKPTAQDAAAPGKG